MPGKTNLASTDGLYDKIAELHSQHISTGFLPKLGTGFLSLLYESIDENPDGILLVEEAGGEVLGFVAGTTRMQSIYRQILKRPVRLITILAPHLFSWSTFKKIIETVTFSREPGDHGDIRYQAELLSMVVVEKVRGKGVAKKLYLSLCKEFEIRRVNGFVIVVGGSLARAKGFYEKCGAKPVGEVVVHSGETSFLLTHRLG